MDFIEIALIDLDNEAAQIVGELFDRYGYGGAVMESYPPDFDKITVRTVIPGEDNQRLREIEVMLTIISQTILDSLPPPRLQYIGKSDWAESWKEHFHPVHVGRHFIIKPSWRDYAPTADELVLEIDPGLAFGSGLHPTTQLCIELLEELPLSGKSLFDVGTGSGILALAGLKLGVTRVRAVDIDEIAIRVTQENFERNGYTSKEETITASISPPAPSTIWIETIVGSAADNGDRQWEVIVANILAHTIIELMPNLAAALAPGGQLILSGLLAEQEASVIKAAAAHGLHMTNRRNEKDWVALVVCPEF